MGYQYVGKNINRIDGFAKVTGQAKYVGDMNMPGMLYGKILRSTVAHAIIDKIDTEKASQLKGVHAILTYENVPQNRYTSTGHPYPDDTPLDTMVLDRKVRFVGDAVAAVAADTPEIAEKALELIEIEYRELPGIFDPEEALKGKAVEIHEGTGNIAGQSGYEFGDVTAGFEKADFVFEEEFKTPIVQHCPMETHISIAYIDENNRLVIHSSTQIPHTLRRLVSQAIGLPISKIRVIMACVGGGFGSKQDLCQEAINALLAFQSRRPVLLEYSREEDMVSSRTRHATTIKLKTGVQKDGRIIARSMTLLSNTGAYSSHGHSVALNMGGQFATLYSTDNIMFEAKTVYTNLPIAGAMRAYGIPQLNFAIESHMDNIARKLNLDPIVFRRKNICKVGDIDPVNRIEIKSCGLEEAITLGEKLTQWREKRSVYASQNSGSHLKRGIGMACFSYACCCYPGIEEVASARVMIGEDAAVSLFLGSAEIGQGSDTIFAQIVAEELGVSVDNINVIAGDTDVCPFDLGAYASRQAYVTGTAVKKAAALCKRDLLCGASKFLGVSDASLTLKDNWVMDEAGNKLMSIAELSKRMHYNLEAPTMIAHDAHFSPQENAITFGATFAEIEVDVDTGKIQVKKIWSILDAGKILNPKLAEGQVHGGISMGVGYALSEELLYDYTTGKILNNNLLDYKLLTALDMPAMEVHFIETNDPTSPFGNKSLGEPPTISVAPAIRNAVLNALGMEFNELPLRPEKVFQRLYCNA